MTDAAANGPEATSTTAQSNSTVVTDNGSNGDAGIKVAGPLNEDNRALVEAKKWASDDGMIDLNKIADGYRNLETHASKALTMPGENATAEEWNAFYKKLGRPDTANDYKLALNREAVPEDFPYDEQAAIEFRSWAHEAGLTEKQAQALHDKFVGSQASVFKNVAEQQRVRETTAHREIVDAWGSAEGESYKANVEFVSRAVHQLGLREALTEGGLLSKDGAILNAKIATALAKVGKELYGEDSLATSASGALSNPFSEGDSFNLTKQGELMRSDPRKAKALVRAAGKNPADYGL